MGLCKSTLLYSTTDEKEISWLVLPPANEDYSQRHFQGDMIYSCIVRFNAL